MAKKQKKPSKTQQLQAEVEQLKQEKAKLQDALDTFGTALVELLLQGGLEDVIDDKVDEAIDDHSYGFHCGF